MAFLISFKSHFTTALVFLLVCFTASVFAVPLDPSLSIALSVVNTDGSTITLTASKNSCVQLPSSAASFAAEANAQITPLFTVYQDATCQTYLYSVDYQLKDLNTRAPVPQGVSWIGTDPSQANHVPGETFVDPTLVKDKKRSYLVQIVIVSLGGAVVLVCAGLYLCYRDKKIIKRGGYNPQGNQQGRPSMAEMSGPGRSVYQYESHHRHNTSGSAASSISFLPPYGLASGANATEGEGVTDTKSPHQDPASPILVTGPGCSLPSSPSQPPPAGFAQDMNYHHQQQPQSPSQKPASDFDVSSPSTLLPPPSAALQLPRPVSAAMPTTRARSYSNLTNRVGTGAGLDPGSVPQGRNAGFGLGYDLEENERGEQNRRRDSDMLMMGAAMMDSPPSSPHLRPSSVLSMGL